jgi:alpha-beta hydrolase superfamily lysophospholipase
MAGSIGSAEPTPQADPTEGSVVMSPNKSTRMPVVLVHSLSLHGESWNEWLEFFRGNGYDAVAASWPGDAETTEATR